MIKKLLLLNCLLVVVIITTSKKSQAQTKEKKEVKTSIIINDGDTIVNGKKFKNLNEDEKAELRKEFKGIKERRILMSPNGEERIMIVTKGDKDTETILSSDSIKVRTFSFNGSDKPRVFEFKRDSLLRKLEGMNIDREVMISRSIGDDIDWEMVHPRRMAPGRPSINGNYSMTIPSFNKPNSNSFNYNTTDKDGYTTKITYTVSEPSKVDLNSIFNDEKININGLNISDVMLVPNFTSGKTTLTFSTKAKGALNIKMLDSAGSTVFSESKTLVGEMYSNSFSAAKNGNYFLQITQGSQTFIRKVTLIRN